MKVKSVTIEGFHNVVKKTYNFNDLTYICGKNGAGKSTILQAVQLGLLGYVPGTKKTKSDIFSHSNNHTMAITVILDIDGNTASIQRVWTKKGNSVSENVEVHPEGLDINKLTEELEIPLFNFNEFVHMTANTLKDWFIDFIPSTTFTTDWKTRLTQVIDDANITLLPDSTIVGDAVNDIHEFGMSGTDEIRQANTHFKSALSFKKKELERIQSTVQSLIYYDDYVADRSSQDILTECRNVEVLKEIASSARAELRRKEEIQQRIDAYKLPAERLDIDQGYTAVCSQIDEINLAFPEIFSKQEALQSEINEIMSNVRSLSKVVKSDGICPYTDSVCSEIKYRIDSIPSEIDSQKSKYQTLEAEYQKTENTVREMRARLEKLEHERSAKRDAYKYVDVLRSSLNEGDVDTEAAKKVEEYEEKLNELREEYAKATANEQYEALSSKLVSEKYKIEQEIEVYKLWINLTGVNGMQTENAENDTFDVLSSTINSNLSAMMSMDVSAEFLVKGKANSFSFGINRNGDYIPYNLLSSGEKCIFMLSMCMALTEYSKSPLKLIIVDDFFDHLDDENMIKVFDALENIKDKQFIFAGVKKFDSECTFTIY